MVQELKFNTSPFFLKYYYNYLLPIGFSYKRYLIPVGRDKLKTITKAKDIKAKTKSGSQEMLSFF
jgi:hypothetical protein